MFLVKLIKEIKNNSKKPQPLPKKKEEEIKPQTNKEYIHEDFTFKPQEKGSSEKEVFLPLDMEDSEDCEFELPSSDDEVDHFQIRVRRGTVKKEKEFESLDDLELVNRQQTEIINISNTLGLPVCVSGTLLRAFQWNTEK
jgi:hypothetical protein